MIAALGPYGFEPIVPGRMSFREQIRVFSEASVVVGPHGAALTNLVFAPHGCRIVEIAPRPIAYMNDFRILADCLDQRIETLVADDLHYYSKAYNRMSHYDFNVDIAAVIDSVSRALTAR